jgi:uncharacterized protein YbaP (TraB family)
MVLMCLSVMPMLLMAQNNDSIPRLMSKDSLPSPGKKYQSLMWEITGPGMKKPSYLYGSMHVSQRVAFHLSDSFFLALKGVNVVALESNPGDWMMHYTTSEYYRNRVITRSNHLSSYRYRNFYRSMFYPDLPEIKTFSGLLSKNYDVMNHMLYRSNEAMTDFQEKTYLDLFIYQVGSKWGKNIIGLEDFEESRRMVREAETPPKKSEKPKKQLTREQSKLRYGSGELIEDAYRRGDLDLLDSLSAITDPYPKYHTWMIVKRNEVMAATIDSVIRSGNAIFAAAGAAHLPGDSGLIEMLRMKGYVVRPVARTINKTQNKTKEKVDACFVRKPSVPWSTTEGDLEVQAPGILYCSLLFSDQGEYLYPDMSNGTYYVVKRFPTYAPFRRYTPEDVKARFDSLVYEFIPGRITRFREVELDGYPAYDISSALNSGDHQRYKIIFSPLEVFILKVSGPEGYMKKDKAPDKFIQSVKFLDKPTYEWRPYYAENKLFTIDIPSYRIIDTTMVFNGTEKDLVIQAFDPSDSSFYMLTKGSYFDFDYIEEDTFELQFMAEQFAEQFEMKINSSEPWMVSGLPALKCEMLPKDSAGVFKTAIIIDGPAYYMLLTTSRNMEKQMKFLNSFQLKRPEYREEEFFDYRDTARHYSVKTVCRPPEENDPDDYYYGYYGDDKEEDKSYLSEESSTYFFNYRTIELVKVEYEKFHKYKHFDHIDSLWAEEIEDINSDSTFIIRKKITSVQTDSTRIPVYSCYVELADTGSSRVIMVKLIQRYGTMYKLYTVSDTLLGPSSFLTRFFDSFTPDRDSLIGWNLFDDKGTLYLNDLVSTDSTLRAQARKSSMIIEFSDKHAGLLMDRIANPVWNEHTFSFRKGLIRELKNLKNPEIPLFLADLYKKIGDTVTLQLAILNTLSAMHSEASAKAFLQCLKTDLPLVSNSSEIDYIFENLIDSLQIARMLFPEILNYTRYREYEDNIYSTLAILADSSLISQSDYKNEFPILLRNAKDAWKRHLAREDEETDKQSEFYSGGSSYSTFGGSYNYKLMNYIRLLLPWMNTDAAVSSLVNQILKSKTTNLRIDMAVTLISKNIPVADSIIKNLSSDPFSMSTFYRKLDKVKKLAYFDTTSVSQLVFAKSLLLKDANMQPRDSIEFMESRYVKSKKGEGYVYFFKVRKQTSSYWSLYWIGIQPADTTVVSYRDMIRDSRGSRIYDNDKPSELIDKEMKKIRLKGRERAEDMNFDKETFSYFMF